MMNKIEYYASVLVTFIFVVLSWMWAWNAVMPMFGLFEINILQSLGMFVMFYLPIMLASIAWKSSDKPIQHFHYDITQGQKQNNTDDN